jgi:hypothetical protein
MAGTKSTKKSDDETITTVVVQPPVTDQPLLEGQQPGDILSATIEPGSLGTVVPDEDTVIAQERVGVKFLAPYQRYSFGDLAGFSHKYAESLVESGVACWPDDFEEKTKKAKNDDYPYAY